MAKIDFAKLIEATEKRPSLTSGLTKLHVSEVLTKFPDGITLTGIDIIDGDKGKNGKPFHFAVFTFAEAPDCFFAGTGNINSQADAWVEMAGGDIKDLNDALKEKPLHIKLITGISRTYGSAWYAIQVCRDEDYTGGLDL